MECLVRGHSNSTIDVSGGSTAVSLSDGPFGRSILGVEYDSVFANLFF